MKQKQIKIHIENIDEALKKQSLTRHGAASIMDKNFNFVQSAQFLYKLLAGHIENVTFQKMVALSLTIDLPLTDMFYLIDLENTISNSSNSKSKKIMVDGD